MIDKGSLHLFIVAVKSIEKNQEILLPPELNDDEQSPLPSINSDLREINKKPLNGLLNSPGNLTPSIDVLIIWFLTPFFTFFRRGTSKEEEKES